MNKKANVQQLSVKMPDTLEPVYSNMIRISHKDDEFTLTFLHRMPETNLAMGRAMVTITPQHAKRLLRALNGLPDDLREVLSLRIWGALSFRRIAALSGVATSTTSASVSAIISRRPSAG